jgi:hypothetical protein
MRRRTLGETLRLIVLATPLLRATGCGGSNGGPCPNVVEVFSNEQPNTACEYVCQTFSVDVFPGVGECSFVTLADGGPGVRCSGHLVCQTGRRPASLLDSSPSSAVNSVGSFFAEAARLEGASVAAFRVLAHELSTHGAPARLARAAQLSAADEIRHAHATAAMARRYAAEPVRPEFGAPPKGRSLEDIAAENAAEGCVRETYGALVALWQARHARDPFVAASMAPIAADEMRHAGLAWDVAGWAEPRLSATARRHVISARTRAFEQLATEVARPVDHALVAIAGLPAADSAAQLLQELGASELGLARG